MISFTIAGTSYQAEEGMTWVEWVKSSYNTDDGFVYIENANYSGGNGFSTIWESRNIIARSGSSVSGGNAVGVTYEQDNNILRKPVLVDSVIIEGTAYITADYISISG